MAENPSKESFQVRVVCYAGHKGDERPIRFFLKDKEYPIEEILDRWYGPEENYFKVRASNGAIYILRHQRSEDVWKVEGSGIKNILKINNIP